MRVMSMLAVILCSASAAALPQEEPPAQPHPKDMIECIDQIKVSGMSESARGFIAHIASIRVGGTMLSFSKDEQTGAYYNSYSGTQCYSPDRDPEEVNRARDQLTYRIDAEIIKLKPLADFDESGFVSTAEGMQFRTLAEFGCKAAHVIAAEEKDVERVCRGLMMTEDAFYEMLASYENFLVRAHTLGLEDFPPLATEEVSTPQDKGAYE